MKDRFPVYDICTLSEYKQDDILISRFAPYLLQHKNLHMAHRHTFYHLVLFTKGGGSHAIDFERFEVQPFQIYFMTPGQVHSWSFEGGVDGYVINFSAFFFQSFLLKSDSLEQFSFFSGDLKDAVINIPAELHAHVLELFEHIIRESGCGHHMSMDMVKVLMLQLFILLDRLNINAPRDKSATYNYTLLRNFQKLIGKHFRELKLPKDYAELLYITPNHLNALCNDLLGISAGDLIRNRITLEAKRLLVNFDLTINQIATELNFADNSYFSKFFKKQEGITPEVFRKQIKTQ